MVCSARRRRARRGRRRRRRRVERRVGVFVFVLTRGGFDGESLESAATLGRLRESLRAFVLHVAATVRDLRPASLDDPVEVPVRASDGPEASLGVFARALGEPTRDAAVAPPRRHLRGGGAGREGGARHRAGDRHGGRVGARRGAVRAERPRGGRVRDAGSGETLGWPDRGRDDRAGRDAGATHERIFPRELVEERVEGGVGGGQGILERREGHVADDAASARARVSLNSIAGCGHGASRMGGRAAITTRTGKPCARASFVHAYLLGIDRSKVDHV